MSTYRHHQHEAKSPQESLHSISRKWDGDSSSERGRSFQPALTKEDHQNAGTPSSKLRWSSWDGWSFIKRWRDGRSWRAWRGDHVAYGARPSSGADFGRNWCRRWWHRSWGGWRGRGGPTLGGEEAPNWGTEHPWSIWEVDCRLRRMFSIASFVVECMTLMSAPHRMTRTWETHCGAWDWSWMKSQNPHLLQKDPKLRQEAEKTSSRRTSCHRGNDGEEPDSLRRRKWPNVSTASQPSCTALVTVKKEVNS